MYPPPVPPPRRARLRTQPKRAYNVERMYHQDATPPSPFDYPFATPFDPPINDSAIPSISPSKDPAALPSRANALSRRCTALANSISNLNAVIEPLKSLKPERIAKEHMVDVYQESQNVWWAVLEMEAQMQEVGTILDEIVKQQEKDKDNNAGWPYEERTRERGFRWG